MPAGSVASWGYRAGVHPSTNADPPYYTLYENTYNVQLEKPNYILYTKVSWQISQN